MRRLATFVFVIILSCAGIDTALAQSQTTRVVVHVRAQDAKFVGTSMGGVQIIIRNSQTGELLAKGVTAGSTGDTEKLMKSPERRYTQLSTPGAAKFETNIKLDEPVLARIEAYGPLGQPQSAVHLSREQWLIPGKDMVGDGILLTLPGFAVDVVAPRAHQFVGAMGQDGIPIRANVVMMCGCPITEGGLWNSEQYDVKAIINHNGQKVTEMPLNFANEASLFKGYFTPQEQGSYEITVYAYDSKSGNTGVDKTTVVVTE